MATRTWASHAAGLDGGGDSPATSQAAGAGGLAPEEAMTMEPAGTPLDPLTETALRSLKDIALPPAVSWMPQTWGWAVLAAILVLIVAAAFILWLRRYRANAYRREALALLAGVEA